MKTKTWTALLCLISGTAAAAPPIYEQSFDGETLDWTRQTNPASNVRVAVWALWVHRTSAEHRLPERVLGGLTGAHHTMRHPEPSRSDRSRRQSNAPA